MPRPSAASPTPSPSRSAAPVVELSAQRLHMLALEAFRIGNRGRLSLCETLRVLAETRLYLELGYPGLAAYADAFFQLRRAEAFECVRVARALAELTELRRAFARGRIGWSVLKAITRVATVDSQAAWIDFARQHGAERTLAEAREALRRGRDAPRESSYGLPNLDQKLVLRFSRSDMDKVRTWIESACATVAAGTGAEQVSPEQAILFLCEQGATADPRRREGAADGARAGAVRAQIVYQHCPDCRKARVDTRDGFVEVSSREVERYAGCAEHVVIDGPTPPALRRRVLAREAQRCGNPRCRQRAVHCHHIVFRSRGGKTELANEVAVCRTCHALIHAGLLRVQGDADGELQWSPVTGPGGVAQSVADAAATADALPLLQLVAGSSASRESADADSRVDGPAAPPAVAAASADADSVTAARAVPSARGGPDREALARGLSRLGVPVVRSRRIIDAAIAALPRCQLTEAGVLRRALTLI